MWTISAIVIVGIVIICIEVPSLLKRKQGKELWTFSVLLFLAVGLGIFQNLDVNIPNPLDAITVVFQPITQEISKLLK